MANDNGLEILIQGFKLDKFLRVRTHELGRKLDFWSAKIIYELLVLVLVGYGAGLIIMVLVY